MREEINKFNESKMEFNYGELIPDIIVDTFYNKIKDKIEHGENYEYYVRNLLKINGDKLPTKIKNLISRS
jgi:hypothetical protein